MFTRKFKLCILLIFLSSSIFGETQSLSLVYKDIGKPPYMEKYPDNSSLYFELASRAAEKCGFSLNVIRQPKVRSYITLNKGEADLYPSGVFNEKRSEFLYFIPNGLFRYEKYYALTALNIPDMNSVQDLNDHELTWLVELGSTLPEQAKEFGVDFYPIKDISIEKAILLITSRRPFCFRVIKEDLERYILDNDVSSMDEIGIKIHENCFPTHSAELYMGFSRNSPYYQEQMNKDYNQNRPLSADNFPVEPVQDSVAARLQQALQEMIDSGEIEELKLKYDINE